MANSPQARKRARQNTARRSRNMSGRSALRTAIKQFLKIVGRGKTAGAAESAVDIEAATAAYRAAASRIDRAVGKGLHHKNRAARLKSRLNNRLRAVSAAGAAGAA